MRNKTPKKTPSSGASPGDGNSDATLQAKIVDLQRRLADAQSALDEKTDELKRARRNEADFREAIETIDSGFAMFDEDDRLVFCNQQYYDTFPVLTAEGVIKPGVRFEDIVRGGAERGRVVAAIGRVEDYVRERMEKHREPGEPYEYFQSHKRWIRTEERRTPSGGYVGTRTDITAFKEIEARLAELLNEQKAQLTAFAQHAPVSFFIKDRDGRYEFVNQRFEQEFGVSAAEIIGKTIFDLVPAENAARHTVQTDEVWRTGVASSMEIDVPTAGGVVRRMFVRRFPVLGADGAMTGLGGINLDITERVIAHQRLLDLSAAIEAMSEPVVVFDADDRFTFANEAYRELNAEVDETIRIGERFEDHIRAVVAKGLVPTEGGGEAEWIAERMRRHRHPAGPIEIQRQNGRWYLGIEKMLPSGGQVLLLTDITAIKQAQAELILARDQAEAANRAKSNFLASMSHELRTPLNAVLGFAQILLIDGSLDADKRTRAAQRIINAGDILLALVEDVLDLARIESGNLGLSIEDVSPGDIIESSLHLTRPMAEARGSAIRVVECSDALPGYIRADRTRTQQVLLNLLTNAIKYGGDDGVVEINVDRGDDNSLRFAVADNGAGIPAEKRPLLFSAFERLGREASEIEGTGIGLAIAKALIEAMAGRIGFSSRAGGGSVFWFELPVSARTAVDGDAAADTPRQTASARTGELGIEAAVRERPDLIFLDINLPGMDGIEVMKKLSSLDETGDIPIIALSASAMPSDIERAKDAGFTDYLTKPIEIAKVLGTIDWIAEKSGGAFTDR